MKLLFIFVHLFYYKPLNLLIMYLNVYHLTPYPQGWQCKKEKAERASFVESTKALALAQAIKLCKANEPSQLKIHRADGTIEEERGYGYDPTKYKG